MEKRHWQTILNSMGFVVHQLQEPCDCGRDDCESNRARAEVLFSIGQAWPEVVKESGIPDDELPVAMRLVELDVDEDPIITGESGNA
jgi:hypothetical protein